MTRTNTTWRSLTAVAATSLLLTACGTTGGNGGGDDPTGEDPTTDVGATDGQATDGEATDGPAAGGEAACDKELAFFGALTGPAAGLGEQILFGVELAVNEYNEENPDCQVTLQQIDSQGSPDQAPSLATEAAGNENLVGIIGPAFSGESNAAGPIFSEAGLPTISPSATNPALAENGWDTFHRILGNDATQGPAAATYIADTIDAQAVFVLDDASEYGAGLARIVEENLGDTVVGTETIQAGDTDFSAVVTAVNDAEADTLFFGGYYAEAALIISQLRDGGWEGTFVVADGVKDPGYLDGAGEAAEGTIITCPCIPGDDPAVEEFATAFAEANGGEAPGTYSAEAYDATNVFLAGLESGAGDREAMLEFINNYDAPGVTKQVSFDETGEVADIHVYAYSVEGGEIVSEQEIE